MSSYGSNKSGLLHPQYQPQTQAPPYPTTPTPASNGVAQSPFYPPTPQPQQHTYSSSPTSQPSPMAMIPQDRRRSSSSSSYHPSMPTIPQQQQPDHQHRSSSFSYRPSMPMQIPMRQPNPADYHPSSSYPPQPVYAQQMPVYARSPSHHPQHMYDPHTYADGEVYDQYARIDEETEREFEKRYAREKKVRRELESRPTLGGSLLSMGRTVGRALGGD